VTPADGVSHQAMAPLPLLPIPLPPLAQSPRLWQAVGMKYMNMEIIAIAGKAASMGGFFSMGERAW
jgi:hypothetical protein